MKSTRAATDGLVRTGLLGATVLLGASCSLECGREVYPDLPDSKPRSAIAMTQAEVGPALPFTEVVAGQGRIAMYGRKLGLRATFRERDGTSLGSGTGLVLFPKAEAAGGAMYGLESGEMPVYFGPVLAGMRVGGTRRFEMPASSGASPEPWCFRGIGRTVDLAVPSGRPVVVELEVVSVCKPKICVQTTWSIPAMRNRRMVELGCR
jgi:hypothetical protein